MEELALICTIHLDVYVRTTGREQHAVKTSMSVLSTKVQRKVATQELPAVTPMEALAVTVQTDSPGCCVMSEPGLVTRVLIQNCVDTELVLIQAPRTAVSVMMDSRRITLLLPDVPKMSMNVLK